jgi:guanosine-3',5'-bis(diphosphate) 3'-pyrophosphohydrolase
MPLSSLHRALSFALQAHLGIDREGDAPLPYFTHPIEVLANLRYVGGVSDPDMLCVAVLHDVVEESPIHLAEIEAQFGPRVASLVKELTRREPGPDETSGLDKGEIWNLRSEILLGEIAKMSADAQVVKLADRLSNIREAKRTKRNEKLKRYLGQTKKILDLVPESVNPGLWQAIRKEM